MTQEELYEQRLKELKLIKTLYKEAKADYRKALLGNVSNKLLTPFKKASKEISIIKSKMISEYENKRQAILLKQIEFLEKKDQRLEDAANYIETVKSDVKEFSNNTLDGASTLFNENMQKSKDTVDVLKRKGVSTISSASCFISNVKTSLVASLDKKTTLHRDLESKILSIRENKANKDYERALETAKLRKIQEEIDNSIARENEYSDDVTIRERFSKINKNNCYMGAATNRVVDYFRTKKSDLGDKIFDAKVEAAVVMSKVSKTKSKITTVFNNQINNLKNKADNVIGNTMVAMDDTYNNIKEGFNNKVNQVASAIERKKEIKQRKENMISAINEKSSKENAIRKAQLDMKRQALADINNSDIFDGAATLVESNARTI